MSDRFNEVVFAVRGVMRDGESVEDTVRRLVFAHSAEARIATLAAALREIVADTDGPGRERCRYCGECPGQANRTSAAARAALENK